MKMMIVCIFVLSLLSSSCINGVQGRFYEQRKIKIYGSGDCIDRAVRIRQSLLSDGYVAEMVVGTIDGDGHCWIRYKDKKTGEWINIWNLSGD